MDMNTESVPIPAMGTNASPAITQPKLPPYKLASRETRFAPTIVRGRFGSNWRPVLFGHRRSLFR